MESKLAKLSRKKRVEAMRRLTPEQRLKACVTHSQLLLQLHTAGKRLRSMGMDSGIANEVGGGADQLTRYLEPRTSTHS